MAQHEASCRRHFKHAFTSTTIFVSFCLKISGCAGPVFWAVCAGPGPVLTPVRAAPPGGARRIGTGTAAGTASACPPTASAQQLPRPGACVPVAARASAPQTLLHLRALRQCASAQLQQQCLRSPRLGSAEVINLKLNDFVFGRLIMCIILCYLYSCYVHIMY